MVKCSHIILYNRWRRLVVKITDTVICIRICIPNVWFRRLTILIISRWICLCEKRKYNRKSVNFYLMIILILISSHFTALIVFVFLITCSFLYKVNLLFSKLFVISNTLLWIGDSMVLILRSNSFNWWNFNFKHLNNVRILFFNVSLKYHCLNQS